MRTAPIAGAVMAKLDDAGLRSRLLEAVSSFETTAQAAAHVGTSRSAVAAYAASHAEFSHDLDIARRQRKALDLALTSSLPAPVREPPPRTARDRESLMSLLWSHAENPESRACSKALHVLAEYHLGSEVHAAKLEAARRAAATEDDAGPERLQVRMLVPTPTKHPRVLDAVVVDAKTDSSS